jgi:hypothetical protein
MLSLIYFRVYVFQVKLNHEYVYFLPHVSYPVVILIVPVYTNFLFALSSDCPEPHLLIIWTRKICHFEITVLLIYIVATTYVCITLFWPLLSGRSYRESVIFRCLVERRRMNTKLWQWTYTEEMNKESIVAGRIGRNIKVHLKI